MKKITLSAEWSYRTPLKTITYRAGEHEVTNDIADAAEKAGVVTEGKADGRGSAKTGPSGPADAAEG